MTVGDRRIGSGMPGAVTLALLDAFRRQALELSRATNLELKQ